MQKEEINNPPKSGNSTPEVNSTVYTPRQPNANVGNGNNMFFVPGTQYRANGPAMVAGPSHGPPPNQPAYYIPQQPAMDVGVYIQYLEQSFYMQNNTINQLRAEIINGQQNLEELTQNFDDLNTQLEDEKKQSVQH